MALDLENVAVLEAAGLEVFGLRYNRYPKAVLYRWRGLWSLAALGAAVMAVGFGTSSWLMIFLGWGTGLLACVWNYQLRPTRHRGRDFLVRRPSSDEVAAERSTGWWLWEGEPGDDLSRLCAQRGAEPLGSRSYLR